MEQETLMDIKERAQKPNSNIPHPFLKWAGSKRYLLKHIVDSLPKNFNSYREPFLGSGALFFLLNPTKAMLSDTNAELINTFAAIRDNVESVIEYIQPLKPNKTLFYKIRNQRSVGKYKRAAEFIYLNKSCWNGLYRVNSKGVFNVPYGSPKSDVIASLENLRACSKSLNSENVQLSTCDFEESLSKAQKGDLVYLDPPYVTSHSNNGFIEYNEKIFSWADQVRLANIAKDLVASGVYVIASNANHKEVLKLYQGFAKKEIFRNSTLASDVTKRGVVSEVLLVSQK